MNNISTKNNKINQEKLNENEHIKIIEIFSKIQSNKIKDKEQIKEYKTKIFALNFMLFYIVIYFFVSATLLIANCQDQEVIDKQYDLPFHYMDFWGSFVFSCVEVYILNLANMLEFGSIRFFIGLIGIGSTLITAILFSLNPFFWDLPCHWLEFSAQFFLTLSDFFFILNQFQNKDNILYKYRFIEITIVIFILIASVFKLLIFGELFNIQQPERFAHFIEFAGEMANALFAFMFTYILYKDSNSKLNQFMEKENMENNC